MTPERNQAATVSADSPERHDLIWESYREVLDATKHQDDKIGRLLTAIAFLTAASLALAGLHSAEYLTRRFVLPPATLSLGVISLTVFLLGIVLAVLLFLTSIGTPLRQPGISRPSGLKRARSEEPGSLIYFYEISDRALQEWEDEWKKDEVDLQKQQLNQLVREIHNLAVRTTFKYDRSNEGMTVLSLALLAFSITVISTAIAATTPRAGAITLQLLHRIFISAVFVGYTGAHLIAALRNRYMALEDTPPVMLLGMQLMYVLSILIFFPLVIVPFRLTGALTLAVIMNAGGVVLSYLLAKRAEAAWVRDRNRAPSGSTYIPKVSVALTSALFSLAAVIAAGEDSYGWRLALAALGVVVLMMRELSQSTIRHLRRQRDFRSQSSDATSAG